MAKAPNPNMTKLTLIHPSGKTEQMQGHLDKHYISSDPWVGPKIDLSLVRWEPLEVPSEEKTPEQEREELLQAHRENIGKRIRDLKALRLANEQAKERMELQHAQTEQNAYHGLMSYVLDAWKGGINGQDLFDVLPEGSQFAMTTVLNDVKRVIVDDLSDMS